MGVEIRRMSLAGVRDLVEMGLRTTPRPRPPPYDAMLDWCHNSRGPVDSDHLVVAWFKTLYPSAVISSSRVRSSVHPETDTDYIVTLPTD